VSTPRGTHTNLRIYISVASRSPSFPPLFHVSWRLPITLNPQTSSSRLIQHVVASTSSLFFSINYSSWLLDPRSVQRLLDTTTRFYGIWCLFLQVEERYNTHRSCSPSQKNLLTSFPPTTYRGDGPTSITSPWASLPRRILICWICLHAVLTFLTSQLNLLTRKRTKKRHENNSEIPRATRKPNNCGCSGGEQLFEPWKQRMSVGHRHTIT
jgi:hypothetical protein